ncbi:Protein-glutamate methylesterase [Saliniradius amylolyticus]|uniref:Protein-glutamate methylesterase/protein-glutamine glutaminase n=1 Tax=Saliniradius amylolyticus TaxID=2183582 RepID=A0A2S2E2Q7_9ALTE|nr:chemotaxis response regulator protein-glutamate methylesterase [Saliniradius amylolyticus]AWL11297.1 Protein-glutamate methylesterase [Saliniradius amylolyticus]
MAYKVLVVDDSTFFRRRVAEILDQEPGLEVVGQARNGKEALTLTEQLDPDVITMDVEMPIMDGITAVGKIMAQSPRPIIMFSSLTHEGAQATLDALDAGALDFLPKKFEDIAQDRKEAVTLLRQKVKSLARKRHFMPSRPRASLRQRPLTPTARPDTTRPTPSGESQRRQPLRASGKSYKVLAIGASTGGPVALQQILSNLPANFPYPVLLVQHMPGTFTKAFAERLDGLCKIRVKEAAQGDVLKPGHAYLAPGGTQMLMEGNPQQCSIKIIQEATISGVTYKPSVDLSFASLGRIFGGDVLAIVLTGMGADGREGCRSLKQKGATIWAQDEKTSVVYGMPQAVASAGLSSKDLPIDQVVEHVLAEMKVSG